MINLTDLPVELVPSIIQHVVRPSHLADLCLVNEVFYPFAVELLYRAVFIYSWHKDWKTKVIKLFQTLASCPRLAKHVRRLTIRDFPKTLKANERDEVIDLCIQALRNCTNLQSCTWTRDGSLTTEILQTLSKASQLSDLEVNGRNEWRYDERVLVNFKNLKKITLIMPSGPVIDVLPQWTASTAASLRHLTLICRSSTVVTDQLLMDISPNLTSIEKLYIVGCPKVSHVGLWALLSHSKGRLLGLGLEGLSTTFDMARFSEQCSTSGVLRSLRSITLSVDNKMLHSSWTKQVTLLLRDSPLEEFHMSSNGGEVGLDISAELCADIVAAHGSTMKCFSVHRLRMDLAVVEDICRGCPNLERLFVTMEQEDLDGLGPCLSMLQKLQTVHVHRPVSLETEDLPVISTDRIMTILRHCNWTLRQIGFNTRVHQIDRLPVRDPDGTLKFEPCLVPYESPEVPEQFLVVRT